MKISSNKKYIIALLCFAGVCVLRFFDMHLSFHSMPIGIMQNYRINQLMVALYFLCFFVLVLAIMKNDEGNKTKRLSYLIMFASVFFFPMFLNENYFGTSDIYAWIICFIALLAIAIDKVVFLIPLACFVMTAISPMSLFSIAILISVILVLRFVENSKMVYIISSVASIVLSLVGMLVNAGMGIFTTDVQHELSLIKFLIAVALFIPYLFIGLLFLSKLFKKVNAKKKICYIVAMVLGLIAPIIYVVLGDYSRAIFYGFVYYIIVILMEVYKDNKSFDDSLIEVGAFLDNYIAFPAILIAYPFVVMTMWVSGPVTLFVETFVGL